MKLSYFFSIGLIGACALSACQSSPRAQDTAVPIATGLPLTTSIAFQADLVGCKRSVLNLYRQTGTADFEPVDRLVFVDGARGDESRDAYDARGQLETAHMRAMVPGKYHIRSISCGRKAPRDEFAIGSFDVIEGRVAYIGKLVVGKEDGRVLLRVDNEAEAAFEAVKASHPDVLPRYGIRLMVSNIPS